MNLFKKIIFYLFICLSIILAVWGYFYLQKSKEPNVAVLDHISIDATCIIETKNCSELISKLTRQNLIWNSLLDNASMIVAQNGIKFIDSLVNLSADVSKTLSNNSVYWSFIKQNKTTEHLILFKLKEKSHEEYLLNFFNKNFTKEINSSNIETYYFKNNNHKWYFSYNNGIAYLCSSLKTLINSIELKKEESMSTNKSYLELFKLNGGQNSHIYINHYYTPILKQDLFSKQSLFGIDVELNEITLTGYTTADSISFLNCLKNQNAGSNIDFKYMPDLPSSIQGITLSNVALFYNSLNKYLPKKIIDNNTLIWQNLNDSALYDIRNESYENIDKSITLFTYDFPNSQGNILSIKLKDIQKTEALLKLVSDSVVEIEGKKSYRLKQNLMQLFLFNKQHVINQYACLSENNLLLFSDKALFDFFIKAISINRTLAENKSFMLFAKNNLETDCNYLYYENYLVRKTSSQKSLIQLQDFLKSEKALSEIALTSKNYKNTFQIRLNFTHETSQHSDSNNTSLWSYKSPTIINSKIFPFTNHLTQETELCFQDEFNHICLISSTGNLIFKTKINESLKSDIYTVDIFKNGKLQLLFNTENYIHLIDRNGNYVKGFPVKLPARATSHLTVFDYDNNKDYRLMIACSDKKIYNFSLYGVKTEGFVPFKTDNEVQLPIYYVKVGASDYLITADVLGKIYAFSRKGLGRIDFKSKTPNNLGSLFLLQGNNLDNTKLVFVDPSYKTLRKISLTDKVEDLKITDDISDFKFSFKSSDNNFQPDVFMYGNGAFYCYDLFTDKILEYRDNKVIYDQVDLAKVTNHHLFLAHDKINRKLDVVDFNGKLLKSFSEITQPPCIIDLYKNGKTYILLVNNNILECYELR